MDGLDGQLLLGQLYHEGHDQVVVAALATVAGPAFTLVSQPCLVAVVTIGDQDGRRGDQEGKQQEDGEEEGRRDGPPAPRDVARGRVEGAHG